MNILDYIEKIKRENEGERIGPRTMAQEPRNMADGGRIGFADGPPGKLKIKKPLMTPEKQKISASPLKEDYVGQLKDKRKVRTSTLDDAFEIRNIIVKNKGHVGSLEELGKWADIVGSGGKVDHRKTKLALDLAIDSFEELNNFKLADIKYPKINAKKFRYLEMVAKSFANYNMTDDAIEAAAHLLQDNMAKIVDMGGRTDLERGFFNLRGKITSADKKFISERVATLTGKDFNIDGVNELIEETSKVRTAKGSIAAQLKIHAKMNKEIKTLADDSTIKNLLKGKLDRPTQKLLLERATKLVGGDASIASRRLFQMAEAMSDTTNAFKNLDIKINNNTANKIIATGKQIGGRNNRYGMSSVLYDYYGNVVDKTLGATEGKTFIGKYQQEIRNLLDKGQSPDEIFSLTASARRGLSPYAIFTQNLRTDVNSAIKGAYIDGELSKKHEQLQKIFQGKTYDKLNTQEKKAVQKLVSDFEKTKIDALNKPVNPGEVKKGAKPIYLNAAEKKNIQLPEFDLKNPPSKSIEGFEERFKKYPKIKKAFETSYKKVGYSMKVTKDMLTQKEFLKTFSNTMQTDLSPRSIAQLAKEHDCGDFKVGGSIMSCLQKKFKADPEKFLQRAAPLAKDNVNLFKFFKNARKIARGTGVLLAWEAAFAPIVGAWSGLEGESGARILNDIAYGIPFIGETVKEEWKREAGGDELAYKMKQMGELENQEIPYLQQQLNDVINKTANVPGKGPQQRWIERDIEEKKLELQALYNTPEFYEGPAGGASAEGDYGYNEPVIQDAYALEQQTTAKIAADKAARKKQRWESFVPWTSQRQMAGGGMVGIRKPNAIAPTGGPMSQGLRSLYINDKDY